MRKTLLSFILICFISAALMPICVEGSHRTIGLGAYIPPPRILAPVGEKTDISGKDSIEFVWSPHESRSLGVTRYYDFRIYKGYELLESTLLFKKEILGDEHRIKVNTDIFTPGEVYTLSIRQGYKSMGKSRRSIYSFEVVK